MSAPLRCVWMDCSEEAGITGLCEGHRRELLEGNRRSPSKTGSAAKSERKSRQRQMRLALGGPHPNACLCLDCAPFDPVLVANRPDAKPPYEIPEGWKTHGPQESPDAP